MRIQALSLSLALIVCAPARAMAELGDSDIQEAVEALVGMQEGPSRGEWPYEGVYRVANPDPEGAERHIIPIGYRVGGTSIVGSAVFLAPGYVESGERQAAIERAVGFVCQAVKDPLMEPVYESGYDVRCWGYIYALDFLLLLEREQALPEVHKRAAKKAIHFYLASLQELEIPGSGGWNYARPRGPLSQPAGTSPFMTGPALQALFAAKAQGYRVRSKVVERALDALERGRVDTGEVVYSTMGGHVSRGGELPGSVGRMLAVESTLRLAGRGDLSRVRGAIDAFLVHWEWLDQRRAKSGTHKKPYGVAPYYFYYAHDQAGRAIELLPEAERGEYRRRLRQRLEEVQLEDGTWNDRVFPRTANYGTACSVLALIAADRGGGVAWEG